ncbi:hypothetical protein BDA99DRAFT_588904 [Phascolomyces articulosus]|uniref:Galactose oxidase n=1 Tax=Phascolomyces articulosus TaxID=60185 RepID=A0AAD5K9V2_9FUNG|nr:hypothetical protein BDA99DRAFT_588904 [Phascolomyces articulosus]
MLLPMTNATVPSLLLLLLLLGQKTNGLTPVPRTDTACAFLPTTADIFCYGGQSLSSETSMAVSAIAGDIFIKLDLTKDMNIDEIQDAWEQVYTDVGPNYYFAYEAVPDQDLIFMDGGKGTGEKGQTLARHNTTIYNGQSENWSSDTPARGPMVQTHTATLGEDNNTIYVWGGFQSINTGLPEGSPEGSQWNTGNAVSSLDASRFYHKAARVGTSIYYIGGRYPLANNASASRGAPMDSVTIFDTNNGQWRTQGTTGPVPSTRTRHTVTLIPDTNQIILFGGQNPFSTFDIREDYFYLLDTGKMEWSNSTLGEEGVSFNGTGIRGHSAVLVGDNLYIMFGRVRDQVMANTNRVWILDIKRWTWVSSVSAVVPQPILLPSDSTGGSKGSSGSNNSTSTIAGAVVGGVVGVSIVTGALIFFLRRKRRSSSRRNQNRSSDDRILTMDDVPPNYCDEGYQTNNKHPMLPITPHEQSSSKNVAHSFDDTDHSVSKSDQAPFYSLRKPDANTGDASDQVQRIVMTPVKPDGA